MRTFDIVLKEESLKGVTEGVSYKSDQKEWSRRNISDSGFRVGMRKFRKKETYQDC